MNAEEFREFGKATVDYIADYFEDIRKHPVLSKVQPGYLKELLPNQSPKHGEPWQDMLKDVDEFILPGMTHWHSPNFHAYYPTANSFPAIVGDLVLSGLGAIAIDWESNPACVELELRMMDWLAKLLGLPEVFLNSDKGSGGGVIQNAASDSTLVALLAAKHRKIKQVLQDQPQLTKSDIECKLIAYTSEQSNSSVEKSGLLASIKMKLLPPDNNGSLRGSTLLEAMESDKRSGLIPCCVVATLGTTGTCAFDDLVEIGQICSKEHVWMHVDAAYAGAALSCPEYRYLLDGIEFVDTFNFNAHKWMLVNADCSAMWFRNTFDVEDAFKIQAKLDLKDPAPEIEHWQIPDRRRFRALKLWFVLRSYGVEGIQKHIRHQISLATYFEQLVRNDRRFEVVTSSMGVVCFRLIGQNRLTREVLEVLERKKKLFIMPYYFQDKLLIRLVVCSRFTEKCDIQFAWNEVLMAVSEKESLKMYDFGETLEDTIENVHVCERNL